MRCVRCQQELPPRAGRCPRCFATNLANRAEQEPETGSELPSEPVPRPLRISLESDPGPDQEPGPLPIDPHDAVTDPPSLPPPPRVRVRALCGAWLVDLAVVCLLEAAFVALTLLVLGRAALAPLGQQSADSWADGLLFARGLPRLWLALGAALGVAYSWVSVAFWGRTAGQRLAGFRLLRAVPEVADPAEPVDPLLSLLHALLGLASFGALLAGFAWALLDPRRQSLHDKVCGVAPEPEPAPDPS
jgi:hypothetical protein